jgi:hypothetical protein
MFRSRSDAMQMTTRSACRSRGRAGRSVLSRALAVKPCSPGSSSTLFRELTSQQTRSNARSIRRRALSRAEPIAPQRQASNTWPLRGIYTGVKLSLKGGCVRGVALLRPGVRLAARRPVGHDFCVRHYLVCANSLGLRRLGLLRSSICPSRSRRNPPRNGDPIGLFR